MQHGTTLSVVIPAEAGIHVALKRHSKIKMDSRFRGNDGIVLKAMRR
jgi:hypothetical protein